MALTEIEQLKKIIEDKKHILIVFRADGRGDAIGSALAWQLYLTEHGKQADVVCADFALPDSFKFLKGAESIKKSLGNLQKFIILVDGKKAGIKELSYDVKDEKLRIFITAKEGSVSKEDITTMQSEFKYDLIFALDAPDPASLGNIFFNNTDFFARTPIVNIDHKAGNEHFGGINFVDITASTTAELSYGLFQKMAMDRVTPEIANALLAGMIAGTNSFKKPNVRPAALSIASELVNLGADRGNIIKNLYQTKSIAAFRLWGAVLSHLQHDYSLGLVWSIITRDDFARTGAKENDLEPIVDELIANSAAAQSTLLLYERPEADETGKHAIQGLFQTKKNNFDSHAVLAKFKPKGEKNNATFKIMENKTLKEAEEEIIQILKQNDK